jgi:hypothetical protein
MLNNPRQPVNFFSDSTPFALSPFLLFAPKLVGPDFPGKKAFKAELLMADCIYRTLAQGG